MGVARGEVEGGFDPAGVCFTVIAGPIGVGGIGGLASGSVGDRVLG